MYQSLSLCNICTECKATYYILNIARTYHCGNRRRRITAPDCRTSNTLLSILAILHWQFTTINRCATFPLNQFCATLQPSLEAHVLFTARSQSCSCHRFVVNLTRNIDALIRSNSTYFNPNTRSLHRATLIHLARWHVRQIYQIMCRKEFEREAYATPAIRCASVPPSAATWR